MEVSGEGRQGGRGQNTSCLGVPVFYLQFVQSNRNNSIFHPLFSPLNLPQFFCFMESQNV